MAKRGSGGPTLRSWLVAGVLGSTLALLFDGANGKNRRQKLMQFGTSFWKKGKRQADKQARYTAGRTVGTASDTLNVLTPDNANPDDNTLRDRIESEVFGDPKAPKGEYNLNVVSGIAILRGQLDSESDIQTLIDLVGAVPHVRGVESYLHTPGTPAPNKESAIHASEAS